MLAVNQNEDSLFQSSNHFAFLTIGLRRCFVKIKSFSYIRLWIHPSIYSLAYTHVAYCTLEKARGIRHASSLQVLTTSKVTDPPRKEGQDTA